jgi:hypothetical protein
MKKQIVPNLNYLSGSIHFGYLAQSLDSFSSEVKFKNLETFMTPILHLFESFLTFLLKKSFLVGIFGIPGILSLIFSKTFYDKND